MAHEVKYTSGLFKPGQHFSGFSEAEGSKGIAWRVSVSVLFIGALTSFVMYLFTDEMLFEMQAQGLALEEASLIVNSIVVASGVFAAGVSVILLLLAALIFWGFFRELGFKKLFVLFSYFLPVYILTVLFDIPFYLYMDLGEGMSMTSLGLIADYLWDQPFLIALFTQLSLLYIWCFLIQVNALKVSTTKSMGYIVTISAIAYLIVMLISSGMTLLGTM